MYSKIILRAVSLHFCIFIWEKFFPFCSLFISRVELLFISVVPSFIFRSKDQALEITLQRHRKYEKHWLTKLSAFFSLMFSSYVNLTLYFPHFSHRHPVRFFSHAFSSIGRAASEGMLLLQIVLVSISKANFSLEIDTCCIN